MGRMSLIAASGLLAVGLFVVGCYVWLTLRAIIRFLKRLNNGDF